MSVVPLKGIFVTRPAWPVAIQLARREGTRMLRHPIMWLGSIFSLAMFGLFTFHSAPVLHRDDAAMAGALLPLAAATLITAHLGASRAARNSTEELYEATSTSATTRTLAHLFSLGYAVALAALLIGVMLLYLFLDAPVGTARPAEILSGVLVVVLLGATGVAVGNWKRHPAVAPMAVVVIGAIEVLLIQPVIGLDGTTGTVVSRMPWLAPWVPLSMTGQVPPELVIRPATWHLLYLAGITAVVAAVALSRSGRRARFLPLFIAGAVGVVGGSIGQLAPASAQQRAELAALIEHPEDHQVCEERREITYCAYPAYAGWIDRWAAPIEGALRRIPAHARPEDVIVRQRFGSYFEGPIDIAPAKLRRVEREQRRAERAPGAESTIWTGIRWGRGATEGGYAVGLSLAIAMDAVDMPSSRDELIPTRSEIARFRELVLPTMDSRSRAKAERVLSKGTKYYSCNTSHQARALAALWIAIQATPETRAAAIDAAADGPLGIMIYETEGQRFATYGSFLPLYPEIPPPMFDRISFGGADFHYAVKLLRQPDDKVAAVFADRWRSVTRPTTLTGSLLDDLDLEPHPTLREQIARLPDDVQLEKGLRRWAAEAGSMQTLPCL